jgi:hypothetical protein
VTSTFAFQSLTFRTFFLRTKYFVFAFYVDQGSAAVHHSNSKAKLKYPAGKGLLSFPAALFSFFFGQAKKKKQSS